MRVDVEVDERTLREIYLPQFEAAVKEAQRRLGDVLLQQAQRPVRVREPAPARATSSSSEWGFKGFVLADYGAAHDTAASLNERARLRAVAAASPTRPRRSRPRWPRGQADAGRRSTSTSAAILRTLFAYGFFDRDAYARRRRADRQAARTPRSRARSRRRRSRCCENRGGALPLDAAKLKSIARDRRGRRRRSRPAAARRTSSRSRRSRRATGDHASAPARASTSRYDDGSDAARAAATSRSGADVAIVVRRRLPDRGRRPRLPRRSSARDGHSGDQDGADRRRSRAGATRNTVVVLETGGPVLTPWRDEVAGARRGLVPRPAGRAGDRARAVRRRRPGRPPAGDVPDAARPTCRPPATRRSTRASASVVHVQGGRPRRLPLVRREEPAAARTRSASACSYTTLRLSAACASSRDRRRRDGDRRRDATPARARGTAVPQLYLGLPSPGAGRRPAAAPAQGLREGRAAARRAHARELHARRARALLLGHGRAAAGASRPGATASPSAARRATCRCGGAAVGGESPFDAEGLRGAKQHHRGEGGWRSSERLWSPWGPAAAQVSTS